MEKRKEIIFSVMKYILMFMAFSMQVNGFGCSCIKTEKVSKTEFEALKGAYLGTIIKKETVKITVDDDGYELVLERTRFSLLVSNIYKGEDKDTLVFETNKSGGMCGISADLNDRIFISWNEDDGIPIISICSRSLNYTLEKRRIKNYGFQLKYRHWDRKSFNRDKRNVRIIKRFSRKFEEEAFNLPEVAQA